jgi:hypothetical protein
MPLALGKTVSNNLLSSSIAVLATAILLAAGTYICSGFNVSWSIYVLFACLALTPLYVYVWNRPEMRQKDTSDWMRSQRWTWGVLGGLLLGDVIVGKLAEPNSTFWHAAASTPGFYVTLFLAPLGPAALSGLIRSCLRKHVGWESTADE